jgi:hypothetical protein
MSHIKEAAAAQTASDNGANLGSSSTLENDLLLQTRVDESKLVRKIDLRVLPILFAVYVVAFLDRQVAANGYLEATESNPR